MNIDFKRIIKYSSLEYIIILIQFLNTRIIYNFFDKEVIANWTVLLSLTSIVIPFAIVNPIEFQVYKFINSSKEILNNIYKYLFLEEVKFRIFFTIPIITFLSIYLIISESNFFEEVFKSYNLLFICIGFIISTDLCIGTSILRSQNKWNKLLFLNHLVAISRLFLLILLGKLGFDYFLVVLITTIVQFFIILIPFLEEIIIKKENNNRIKNKVKNNLVIQNKDSSKILIFLQSYSVSLFTVLKNFPTVILFLLLNKFSSSYQILQISLMISLTTAISKPIAIYTRKIANLYLLDKNNYDQRKINYSFFKNLPYYLIILFFLYTFIPPIILPIITNGNIGVEISPVNGILFILIILSDLILGSFRIVYSVTDEVLLIKNKLKKFKVLNAISFFLGPSLASIVIMYFLKEILFNKSILVLNAINNKSLTYIILTLLALKIFSLLNFIFFIFFRNKILNSSVKLT